jgi:hypothetical protein
MPSRLGSPNKDKKALRDKAEELGVDVVELQLRIIKDLKKTYDNEVGKPRSRRSKQFTEVEKMLVKMNDDIMPYLHGKLSNVTVTDETPRLTVIRAPETISDTKAWLEKYKPKTIDNGSNASPAIERLQKTVDMADKLGITDDATILKEALKQ